MKADEIKKKVERDFTKEYMNFSEFAQNQVYKAVWDLCLDTLASRDRLVNIAFCNDVYQIPPVRVFIDINRDKIDEVVKQDTECILFREDGTMKNYLKQSIGAFWGMVFKYGMGYQRRKTASVVKDNYYGIQTASRFYEVDKNDEEIKTRRYLLVEQKVGENKTFKDIEGINRKTEQDKQINALAEVIYDDDKLKDMLLGNADVTAKEHEPDHKKCDYTSSGRHTEKRMQMHVLLQQIWQ